jgi:hypothetical protein
MIELNLTYEESKKILELGYDFSSTCTKFELKTDTEYRVVYGTPVERGSRKEIQSSESMEGNGRIVHLRNRSMLDPLMIPIIPEAALEKCFLIDFPSESEYDYRCFEKSCGDDVIELEGRSQSIKFNSAFEAFLWCHENYPAELKAKFDEVMA